METVFIDIFTKILSVFAVAKYKLAAKYKVVDEYRPCFTDKHYIVDLKYPLLVAVNFWRWKSERGSTEKDCLQL